ncbi:MAG: hypothetical protein M9913_17500 [Bryobacteraceae bacterium]|nr:hypothetical protein [Bryobacteraceae bacterium]
MVSFRKSLLLMALLVVVTGIASAQVFNPLSCTANAGVPPIARAEGVAEEVGQVVIVCNGGNPTVAGAPIPTVNVQIFLNTNVTSRLVGNGSEAMLLIDEPAPAIQSTCLAPGNCGLTSANGNGTANYTGGSRYNVYQAVQSGANSVTWLGVPVDPPGTAGNRIIRLTNVRANANQLGVSSTLIPTSINMFISISGTGSLALTNPQLTVAFVQPGMTFSATGGNYNQCEPGTYQYNITFTERFGTAFRHNNPNYDDVTQPSGEDDIYHQYIPGKIYNTESMFTNASPAGGNVGMPAGTGVATQGTRLIARFSNVPANVSLSVVNGSKNTSGDTANRVTGHDANGAGGTVTYPSWTQPNFPGQPLAASGTTSVSLSGGAGVAVWEVVASNPGAISGLTFTVNVTYGSNPLPGLGTATVTGNYAPTTTVFTASSTAPVPRFVDNPQSATTFTINPCQTNILYPFVSNQAGFDTGLVVSNTSLDPYGTVPQRGPCNVYYYGATAGGGAAPATQTSGTVNEGTQLVFTLSSGGNLNIAATPGFQGYIIIRCNFQYGHGFAFVSDLGAQRLAMGYIPLILDQNMFDESWTVTRTGAKSEALNQ